MRKCGWWDAVVAWKHMERWPELNGYFANIFTLV